MSKNPIGLHILFALLGLGSSLLLLGVGGQFVLEIYSYHSTSHNEGVLGAGFCAAGVLCLIFSIGLIMRMEWARIAFQVLLILGGIGWMTFIVFLANDSPRAWAVLIGLAAIGLMVVLFGVLFLESPYFLHDLKGGQVSRKDYWDILDQ